MVFLTLNFLIFASPQILKINISGNKNVSREKILSLMKTKEGNEFDENLIKKDIEQLIKTGYFRNIKYNVEKREEGVELNIEVEENPVIEKIVFKGNKIFKTKKLKEVFDVKEGEILNEEKVISGIEKIKELYYKKGFQTTEIDYEIEKDKDKCILNIEIIERGRGYVKKIIFSGNNSISDKKLKKIMKTKERKMPFIRGTFKKDTLEEDIKRIKEFYNDSGFIEAKVDYGIEYDGKGIILNISIDEGERYFVGEIKFEGDLIFKEED